MTNTTEASAVIRHQDCLKLRSVRYMAFTVQKPWIKPKKALGLYSKEKQVGKGIVVHAFKDIIGPHHATMIQNEEHMMGKHATDAEYRLVIVEEAYFSKNHKHRNLIKTRVTEATATLEKKYQHAVEVDSFTAYIFLTNNPDALEADHERFCILRCNPKKQGDITYFNAIEEELNGGGRQAMLYDLMEMDIRGFDPRRSPVTKALGEMRLAALEPREMAILEVVRAGEVKARDDRGEVWKTPKALNCDKPTFVDKELVYQALARAFAEYGNKHGRETVIGTTLKELGLVTRTTRKRGDGVPACYVFAPLDEIRAILAEKWSTTPEALGAGETGRRAEDRTPGEQLLHQLAEYQALIAELPDDHTDMPKHRASAGKLKAYAEKVDRAEARAKWGMN